MSQVKNYGNDPTDKTKQQQEDWLNDQPYGSDYGDYNFDGGDVDGGGDIQNYGNQPTGGTYPNGGTNPYGPGSGQNPTGKGLATGGGISEPPSSDAGAYLQSLVQQGLSPQQIKAQMQQLYGWAPTDADIQYAKQGLGGFEGPPNGYTQYSNSPQGKTMSMAYGSKGFQNWMDQNQMAQDAKGMSRDAKKKEQEAKVKIHMILLQIMMGDIAGALRSYAVLMDRDMRQFTRLIVKKLDGVRRARSTVIRNFARQQPPRAYAGNNPQTAARAQDKSAKYTQFVQMSTQLMNELQNTERELVDALQTQFRNLETFWQTVATFRDETFRTNDRVMTMR